MNTDNTALQLELETTTESTIPEPALATALTLQPVATPQPPMPQDAPAFTLPAIAQPQEEPEATAAEPPPEPETENAPDISAENGLPTTVAPLPEVEPAPTAVQLSIARERQQYWRSVLTGNPTTVPQEVRERTGANDPGLSPEQQVYTLCSSINRSWMADHSDHSREEIMRDWKQLRSNLAQELDVADDEQEVYVGLSLREADAPRRETARQIYEQAYMSGLQGLAVSKIHSSVESMNEADQWQARVLAAHAYEKGLAQRASWLPMAKTLTKGLDLFAAIEEDTFSAPRVFASAPSLANAVVAMSRLGAEERSIVMYLTQQQAAQERAAQGDVPEDEGLLSRAQRAVRRGASSLGFGLWQGVGHLSVGLQKGAGQLLDGETGQKQLEYAAERDQRLQVLHDIKNMAQTQVYPLLPEEATLAERMFIDAAQATPAAFVTLCGGVGFGALALSGMGESVAEARRRAPEGPQHAQLAAGVVGGAVQAAIYVGMSRVGKKLLEQSIGNFIRARGGNLGDYTLAGLKATTGITAEGVKLVLAGKAAHATDLGMHELAAQLSDTASNIDWQQYGEDIQDMEHNMREAAATLPFLLIGAGRASLRHFNSPDSVIGSGRKLLEWKVDKKTVDAILQESNVDVRSEMLRDAVRQSELWQQPQNHRVNILRAMSLLNTNGRILFRDMDSVSEFLNWEPRFTSASPQAQTPPPAKAIATRTQQGLQLREEWERSAGLWQGPGSLTELRVGNGRSNRVLMNGRGRYANTYYFQNDHPLRNQTLVPKGPTYAPLSEKERTQALTEHFDELRSLSYKLLWQLYSPEAMAAAEGRPVEELRQEAEHTRRDFLNLVCNAIMARARGESESAVFDKQAEDCGQLLRRYSGREGEPPQDAAAWLRKLPDEFVDNIATHCLAPDNKRLDSHAELREFYWLMYRARVCTAVLSDLLPMNNDFQTLLSHSLTPAQAYEYMLKRELMADGKPAEEPAPDAAYAAQNAEQAKLYTLLTGNSIQQAEGKDGKPIYRIVRPDGNVTPWHTSQEAVVNDVAGNAAFTFMPIAAHASKYLLSQFDSQPGLRELPAAGALDYSGHDQLCSIALRELAQSWLEDASHRQPALLRQQLLRVRDALNVSNSGNVLVVPQRKSPDYHLEANTSLTPFGLALGRFRLYWLRQLESGFLPAEEAAYFLEKAEILTPQARARILDMRQERWEHIEPIPRRFLKEPMFARANIAGSNKALSAALSTFTLRYFASRLHELDVPESVKQWYAYSAFSPLYETVQDSGKKLKGLPFRASRNNSNVLSFFNHRSMGQLRELAPHVHSYRELYADGVPAPTIARLLPGAMGQDEHLRLEQVWAHHFSGEGVFHGTDETGWNILHYPSDAWKAFSPEVRNKYENMLSEFCENNPLPLAEGEAPPVGTSADAVKSAIDNLDIMLRICPNLHRYSLIPFEDTKVNVVSIQPRRQLDYQGEAMLGDVQLRGDTHADYEVSTVDMPAFIASSPRVRHALRVLDILRASVGERPYSDGHDIYWGRRIYGKSHTKPEGLQLWHPHPPLRGVRHALYVQKNGTPPPTHELPVPSLLEPITVYHSDFAKFQSYRLMPGMPSASEPRARRPYLVGAHKGMYAGHGDDASGESMPSTYLPLETFVRKPFLKAVYMPNATLSFRRRTVTHNLQKVMDLLEEPPQDIQGWDTLRADMLEQLMRLYEDSGYSENIIRSKDKELNEPCAQALHLADLMLSFIDEAESLHGLDANEPYLKLRDFAQELRENRPLFLDIIEALVTGNPGTERSTGEEPPAAPAAEPAGTPGAEAPTGEQPPAVPAAEPTGTPGAELSAGEQPSIAPPEPPAKPLLPSAAAAEAARNQRITRNIISIMEEIGAEPADNFVYTPEMKPVIVEWLKGLEETGWYKLIQKPQKPKKPKKVKIKKSVEKRLLFDRIMERFKDTDLPLKMKLKMARSEMRAILEDRKDEEAYRREQARKARMEAARKLPPKEDDEAR